MWGGNLLLWAWLHLKPRPLTLQRTIARAEEAEKKSKLQQFSAMAEEREYDIVVFGSTGYTGQFVNEELYRIQSGYPFGRSQSKLEACLRAIVIVRELQVGLCRLIRIGRGWGIIVVM